MQSLACRARDLDLVTDRQYRSLMMQFSKLGWRMDEPVKIAQEEPTVLRSMIDVYRRQGYQDADISVLVMSDEDEFRSDLLNGEPPKDSGLRLAR
jgi:hypothetical protein